MSSTPFKSHEEMVESPYYDPDYSIDINKKMTVPNKIKAVEGSYNEILDDPAVLAIHDLKDNAQMMQVPECIRVAGGESHITTSREPPLEIKLEDKLFGKSNDESLIQLTTPPRTLRYEDAAPIFAEPIKQLDKALNSSSKMNQSLIGNTMLSRMNDSTIIDYDDVDPQLSSQNFIQLRRRVLSLSHRIDALEVENRHRSKRDLILYAVGALYLLFRGLSWFASNGGGGGSRRGFTF
ncbi:transport and golgi organization protein-like protein [Euroglyphus maynei]|uniref:Mitochondrial fission factor n=1 Tax=Euroglyphus maynei TaxID=6958 RepID=A0A1Y3BD68_EURMA|nr:transport and golgi organization protein-like protein [Euroglyphus maynei]